MKVLIIGKNGQLASELIENKLENKTVLCLGRNELDITCLAAIEKAVIEFTPEVIINASAYTAVDNAESDSEAAYAINETAVANLATIAKKYQCQFLHVSTDFIFDGESNKAYSINAQPNPQSVYGASKLAGEKAIQDIYPENSSIIRTSWVYSTFGNNFVKTMLRLMPERGELGIVHDQIGSPTYAKGLAEFIWCLAEKNDNNLIYHWSDAGVASWYDFAVAIQEIAFDNGLLPKKIPVKGIPSSAYPTPAKRPAMSLLNTSTSLAVLQSKHWREQLVECINKL